MSLTAENFWSPRELPFCVATLDLSALTLEVIPPSEFWIHDLEYEHAIFLYWNLAGFHIAFNGEVVVYGGDGESITSNTNYDSSSTENSSRPPKRRVCVNAQTVADYSTSEVENYYEISDGVNFTMGWDGALYQSPNSGNITRQTNGKFTYWFTIRGTTTVLATSPTSGINPNSSGRAAIYGTYSGMGGGGIEGLAGGVRITASQSSISILSGTIDAYMYALDRFGTGSYGDSYISGSGTITDFTPIFYVYD